MVWGSVRECGWSLCEGVCRAVDCKRSFCSRVKNRVVKIVYVRVCGGVCLCVCVSLWEER